MSVLADALRSEIRGDVRFDVGARALYAVDSSNYRQVPVGVVLPRDADDVVAAMQICRDHGAPILPRGAGTSLAGQGCNAAVVLDFSRHMNHVIEIDSERHLARVQPGLVLDRLQDAAKSFDLSFGPDPATHAYCTVGGMIGNNACGVHSIVAGRTVDSVEELEVLTYRGTRLRVQAGGDDLPAELRERLVALRDRVADLVRRRYPQIPRRVSGYNLDELLPERGFHIPRALVGTEGTCVTVLEATVRLLHLPAARSLVVLGYLDIARAADAVPAIMEHQPIGLEAIDDAIAAGMRRKHRGAPGLALLPDGLAWLLVEFGGETRSEVRERTTTLMEALRRQGDAPTMRLCDDLVEQQGVWVIRESALGVSARVPGESDKWEGWEDAAVPPERLGDYLRDYRRLLARHGYVGVLYGHFGDGCVHTRIDFDLTSASGIASYRRFVEEAADLVVAHGGSLSGEHGDGQSRGELLPRMFGEELVTAFREFKAIWDPDGKMNPGKVVDAHRLDDNLRLGTGYAPPQLRTHFAFVDDDASFARAALRCVGVGKCRKTDSGTMCPSYMVTRDETHSTRGRARLFFELLQDDVLHGGWRDEHVREALDLCLSCKGCKGECPTNVDVSTYKAEFLSHYYAHRVRPLHMYAVGLIFRWARLAAVAPGMANRVAGLGKGIFGIAPQRDLPAFASQTFRAWFAQRKPKIDGERVILWPDTFTNYFAPERGRAAVAALEAAGFRAELPARALCCGRPLYDCGMLAAAKQLLQRVVSELRDDLRAGATIVGLEPSCIAVFREELRNLLPNDVDARRLSLQTLSLAELLTAEEWRAPLYAGRAIVHGHCHQKALWGLDADCTLLSALGLDFEILDSGCCGMAGGFGLQRAHYELSLACGERVLLPAVRGAPEDALIVTDGFSCREQIRQTTGRPALHLAEVVELALGGRS